LIIGGGGTARAAVYALKKLLGCGTIYILNRDADEVAAVMSECSVKGFGDEIVHIGNVEQARSLPAPRVIVSAIPDFEPVTESEKMVRECLTMFLEGEKGTILEMCYHPKPQTAIARLVESKRWNLVLGTEAMVWQALEQDRYWTGREVKDLPVEKVRALIKEAVDKSAEHL
jgi:quinate dehydrogenase